MDLHPRLTKWSTWGGVLTWAASGFMAQPSIASVLYHLLLLPVLIVATIWLAHREGKDGG